MRSFGSARILTLAVLLALLVLCLVFAWTTRDAMADLSFLRAHNAAGAGVGKAVVDQSPWQTARALAALAVSAEEASFARDAQRLADHEVDQAFASALRSARLEARRRVLTGDALALSQKIAQLEQTIRQDQVQIESITRALQTSPATAKGSRQPAVTSDDLDVAKAQLGLDSDELADAQHDLARASGDQSDEIQSELAARQAAMKKYDNQNEANSQVAVVSARQHGTLFARFRSWFSQNDRYRLLQQALAQTQRDSASLTAQHNTIEAQLGSGAAAASTQDSGSRLARIQNRAAAHQILSIFDDRIQTSQQLATVYDKWSKQVLLQHRIVLHLILQSLAVILGILIAMVLGDGLVRRLLSHPSLDRRQSHTLRTIFEVGIQSLGAVSILLVVFGIPREITTVLGLVTAGLTIALQDVILSFLGWFVLIGKNGIHVGDWVEINGVGGEVTHVGIMTTTLLETGGLADRGYPTGRRISFLNSFAIHGQYFNFSTTGQWMWDEIAVTVPAGENSQAVIERIHQAVLESTEENSRLAESEWQRVSHAQSAVLVSAAPSLSLRPSASGLDVHVRYVTRASQRFGTRNRLYQAAIDILHSGPTAEQQVLPQP